jgi:hypothetical protein
MLTFLLSLKYSSNILPQENKFQLFFKDVFEHLKRPPSINSEANKIWE